MYVIIAEIYIFLNKYFLTIIINWLIISKRNSIHKEIHTKWNHNKQLKDFFFLNKMKQFLIYTNNYSFEQDSTGLHTWRLVQVNTIEMPISITLKQVTSI